MIVDQASGPPESGTVTVRTTVALPFGPSGTVTVTTEPPEVPDAAGNVTVGGGVEGFVSAVNVTVAPPGMVTVVS